MQKKLIQDIKINRKQGRPEVLKAVGRTRVERPLEREEAREEIREEPIEPRKPIRKKDRVGRSGFSLWVVAVISIMFFLFAISYMFLKVTVTINPKTVEMALNENLSAEKGGTGDALPFDLIVLSGEEKKTVETGGEKDVAEKATGAVVIYNNFGAASQRLDIDTRLEGSNGKIYKTEKAVTVPGLSGGVPGKVEVGIYAWEAGEDYNSGPLDFTIVGFKGTPKYSKFYARSEGEISGGFKGKVPFVSDSEKSKVMADLKTALEAKLLKKATDQIPKGFILFKEAVFLDVEEEIVDYASAKNVANNTEGNMLPFELKGTLYGFLFDEQKLSKKIAKNKIKGYDGSPVLMTNVKNLTFSLISPAGREGMASPELKKIDFNLKGSAKIVWRLDEAKFIADLLGKSKKDFNQILSKYPNVDSADLSISPFWKSNLPDKSKDIKVIVNYPEH